MTENNPTQNSNPGVTQVVECLPSKLEALSQTPPSPKKRDK
jgi:hypothetical protein